MLVVHGIPGEMITHWLVNREKCRYLTPCTCTPQELMRVILGYSVCYTVDEVQQLQLLIKPVLQVLLTRCADAQR